MKDFLAPPEEQAKVKPVDVRIKSCESYLQRCTKQLEEVKASVKNCEEEVAKTQARFGQIEDGSRLATPRAQSAPRGRRIGSDSPPEASVRVEAEVPSPTSSSGIRGGVREFEETSSQTTCVSRPSSVTRTRSGSVDVRQEFGTQGRIGVRRHDIRSGVLKVALRRGVIDSKKSRTVLSSHRLQCTT